MKILNSDFSDHVPTDDGDEQSAYGGDERSVTSTPDGDPSSSRDEAAEIRKQSAKETARVRTWRALVAMALFATAVAVTATTYHLLVEDEKEAFRTVFDQFARTMGDASIRQQVNLREAYQGLADDMALTAEVMGGGVPQWPFFWPPMFEHMASDFFRVSRAEWVAANNIVKNEDREAFENFTTSHFETSYKESHIIRYGNLDRLDQNLSNYKPHIHRWVNGSFVEDEERDRYLVRTMQSPPPRDYIRSPNWNMLPGAWSEPKVALLEEFPGSTLFGNASRAFFLTVSEDEHKGFHTDENAGDPHAYSVHGIHRLVGNDHSELVGWLIGYIAFDQPLMNLLPDNVKGMLGVISNTCNSTFSYVIDGKEAHFQGYEDVHDSKYDDMRVDVDLSLGMDPDLASRPGHCIYTMRIYPTEAFEAQYRTAAPAAFATVVACTFVFVAVVFVMYDIMVLKRNEKMISNAAKSNAIVSSVVPDHLRDRLLASQQENLNAKKGGTLKTFLSSQHGAENAVLTSAPLADLFLETTVCFADIVGFTAWSSVREPSQVFTLLETLYSSFDSIAKKRRIFKVETVGDCYVAVCGLPDPRRDHSVAMARFARDIVASMNVLTNELVVQLGPDTGDLMLRVGLHTGPVTAGVLRGERARFQLFGDTMNTCARVESSSKPNRIQCSKETAEHLIKMGKGAWVHKRPESVVLKGKGSMETFWVTVRGDRAESAVSGISTGMAGVKITSANLQADPSEYSSTNFVALQAASNERTSRLIEWNCEVLMKLLKEIRAAQLARGPIARSQMVDEASLEKNFAAMPLDEVREIVALPAFCDKNNASQMDPEQIKLPRQVKGQLHSYVSNIANLYRDNSFHNFEHASHVMMSVTKLMSRIVPPSNLENKEAHDHTFGINADPLTRFACAFSALIHDVDHTGVNNAQLVKEEGSLAKKYKDRSVAEQHSLSVSWELLMRSDYKDLRAHLFQTQEDLVRFRQLVVNSVMATDIVDKDLKDLRNNRWDKAFNLEGVNSSVCLDNPKAIVDRKATIVIEHIIQASDISHTMQHWFVYRKWNENLFNELYVAYLNGKLDKDPASFWYKGEIGFFDFYIIPLTKKLKECGVFGVSSDEYLNYALKNREEWEERGEAVVASLAEEAKKKYGVKGRPILHKQAPESLGPIQEQAPFGGWASGTADAAQFEAVQAC